jgi:hypothetical protein
MTAVLLAVLTAIGQIAGSLGTPSSIAAIIDLLIKILPTLVKEVQDIAPIVQNIIDALRNNNVITPEQLTALDDLEAKADAAFEAAAAEPDSDGV